MNYRFEYDLTKDDYKNYTMLANRNAAVFSGLVILGAAGFVLNKMVVVKNLSLREAVVYLIPFAFVLLFYFIYFLIIQPLVSKQIYNDDKFYKGKRTVLIDEKHICEKYDGDIYTTQLNNVNKVLYNKKVVVLYTNKKYKIIIPESAFDSVNYKKEVVSFLTKLTNL